MKHNNSKFQGKVQDFLQNCQTELKRTTEIGKKMIGASRTNTCLHEAYEELGALVEEEIKEGRLEWNHPKVESLLAKIEECKKSLDQLEGEVTRIKKSPDMNNDQTSSSKSKE